MSDRYRSQELRQLKTFLTSATTPLVLVYGPHGSGKSWVVDHSLWKMSVLSWPIAYYAPNQTKLPHAFGDVLPKLSKINTWLPDQSSPISDSSFFFGKFDFYRNFFHAPSRRSLLPKRRFRVASVREPNRLPWRETSNKTNLANTPKSPDRYASAS